MFLTVKQKILVTLFEKGPLQNSQIARKAGITEQWCSEMINVLHAEGLIESQFITPRRINKLTSRGAEVAKHPKGISENVIGECAKSIAQAREIAGLNLSKRTHAFLFQEIV